jgi:transitional endoplasmic reticulum ATPase
MDAPVQITRALTEALPGDAGRGLVRLDPADMAAIGVSVGDIVALKGARVTHARVLPTPAALRGRATVAIDGVTRQNAGLSLSDSVELKPATAAPAARLALDCPALAGAGASTLARVAEALDGLPVTEGDTLRIRLIGGQEVSARVSAIEPAPVALIRGRTAIRVEASAADAGVRPIGYEDLGGLGKAVARLREMVELPIRRPDLFRHLGVEAPKGVLLSGPPGTGKTLLARAVAQECQASFFQISGPEIVGKHYGESEAQLREVFKAAAAKAPAIVFIDEIDAIAPKREGLAGDRQVERRIVAQLLTLLDGLASRGQVVVMAATNLPDSLDPALRRPGRFDREIAIGVPDKAGRAEIIAIHTRGMPLAADVDRDHLAAVTHGYVGADLAALAREAAMAALRRHLADDAVGEADLAGLMVTAVDFDAALAEIVPSAIREVFTEIPDVRFADVGGMADAKQALTEAVIWPLKHGAVFDAMGLAPAKGVLLAGPPGTGKTMLAKALATEAGVNVIVVRGPELLNQYLGESERAVRQIFAKARAAAPTIVFFDEIDALAPVRGRGDAAAERVVAQLLVAIDGMEALKGVFLLAATNRIDAVDPAMLRPGRFDRVIVLDLPDAATRREILSLHARALPGAGALDLTALAARAEGFSGAELEAVMLTAARAAAARAIATGTAPFLTAADADAALALVSAGRHARGLMPEAA